MATAEALVKAEAAKLVEHDSAAYPVASAIAAAAAAGLVTVEDGDETNGGKKKKKKKKAKASDAALIAAATGRLGCMDVVYRILKAIFFVFIMELLLCCTVYLL